ncbi:hypothetical protein bplSymb_SCF02601P022 [Bathymodiolus platifrons methanotrophic gill symbiont]|uniref:LamG-like jellyroll fold domain-containing protein n=2 Tax=Bathymodiolus platifrons methanotrophic gill symbiont TaxID=113268 RepID=UPI000B41AD40|nr:LamG-like jellyroll fold domain-containing protein [Bathymodiolus platifrons methanotrophic gill symbiont]GAW86387.1 hypothetical protein bplSymb_SCF02601P022 [Bathymodiolus platifrons methanotrophic gill symbiont]
MKLLITYLFISSMLLVSNSKASLTDGLVAHYKFENDASDSSGNGNDGEERGGVTYTPGVRGMAVEFDGVDDYVYVKHDDSLNVDGDFSVSFWVYRATNNGIQDILVKGRDCLNHYMFNASGSNAGSRGQAFNVGGGSRWCDGVSASASFPIKEWHHVTGVIDNTNGVIKYYLNGELESENPISPYKTTNSYPLIMGRHFTSPDGRWGIYKYQFKGILDEVRIYNRALSDGEIKKLYNPNIGVTPSLYDFGKVKSGEGRTVRISITNTGGEKLTIEDMYFESYIPGESFTAEFPDVPFKISADSEVEIPVNYNPSVLYEYERNILIIESNDEDTPVTGVSLLGSGVSGTEDVPAAIDTLQKFIDEALEEGTLSIIDMDKYVEFNDMLVSAATSDYPCVNLQTALHRVDGHEEPEDWLEGPARHGIAMSIMDLMEDNLECSLKSNRPESLRPPLGNKLPGTDIGKPL